MQFDTGEIEVPPGSPGRHCLTEATNRADTADHLRGLSSKPAQDFLYPEIGIRISTNQNACLF